MDVYLLPSSTKQSSMDLVKEELFKVWDDESKNRFLFLNPEREELIRTFGVRTSPLLPAWRRYRGSFWDNLHFWALPSTVQEKISKKGLIISSLFGLLAPSDLVPPYAVDFKTSFDGKKLGVFWKEKLQNLFGTLLVGKTVLDLLSENHRSVVSFPPNCTVIRFTYIRAGKRVVNPLPHRAYTLRYVAEKDINLNTLEKVNFLDYKVKSIEEKDSTISVIMTSEGQYI